MILPSPPDRYNREFQSRLHSALESEDRRNFKQDRDLEIARVRIVLMAPNGTRFHLTVDNAGVLTAVPA